MDVWNVTCRIMLLQLLLINCIISSKNQDDEFVNLTLTTNSPGLQYEILGEGTVNNNTVKRARKKKKKGGSKKKKNSKKTTYTTYAYTTTNANATTNANTTTNLPLTTSSHSDTNDYPVPYDNFFYEYTFDEYEALITSDLYATISEENHRSGPTATATPTETSAAADQNQTTSRHDHQFKVPEVPPLRLKSNADHSNRSTAGACASGSAGVNEIEAAINSLRSNDHVVVDDFRRGEYVFADAHLWEKCDFTAFTS